MNPIFSYILNSLGFTGYSRLLNPPEIVRTTPGSQALYITPKPSRLHNLYIRLLNLIGTWRNTAVLTDSMLGRGSIFHPLGISSFQEGKTKMSRSVGAMTWKSVNIAWRSYRMRIRNHRANIGMIVISMRSFSFFSAIQVKLGFTGFCRLLSGFKLARTISSVLACVCRHIITPFNKLPNAYIPSIRTSVNNMTQTTTTKRKSVRNPFSAYQAVGGMTSFSGIVSHTVKKTENILAIYKCDSPAMVMKQYQIAECISLIDVLLQSVDHMCDLHLIRDEDRHDLRCALHRLMSMVAKGSCDLEFRED